MGLSAIEKDHNYYIVATSSSECDRRLRITGFSGQKQLETFCRNICENLSEIRYSYTSFFIPDISSTLKIHGKEIRSRKSENQCKASTMSGNVPIYLFPIQTNTPGIVKTKEEKAFQLAPTWQSQGWYSVLLSMCIHNMVLLSHWKDLLLETLRKTYLLANQTLRLAAWLVSGNHWNQKTFQTKMQSLYQVPEKQVQFLLMNQSLGLVG